MCVDVKYFYPNTNIWRFECIYIFLRMIPTYFIKKYNLHEKVQNIYIYAEVKMGVYDLLQAVNTPMKKWLNI